MAVDEKRQLAERLKTEEKEWQKIKKNILLLLQ